MFYNRLGLACILVYPRRKIGTLRSNQYFVHLGHIRDQRLTRTIVSTNADVTKCVIERGLQHF